MATETVSGTVDFYDENYTISHLMVLMGWIERARCLTESLSDSASADEPFFDLLQKRGILVNDAPWEGVESAGLLVLQRVIQRKVEALSEAAITLASSAAAKSSAVEARKGAGR